MHDFRPLAGPSIGGPPTKARHDMVVIDIVEAALDVPFIRDIEDMADLKINEIPDNTIRQKRLKSQRDDGRPTEDDIVREHFGPKRRKKGPNKLPLEANTRRDLPVIGVK